MKRGRMYRQWITSPEWVTLRSIKIKSQPLCEECQRDGILRAATEVHHIKPVESVSSLAEQQRRMFDYGNLASLCHECHKKMHRELGSHKRKEIVKRREERTQQDIARLFGERGREGGLF